MAKSKKNRPSGPRAQTRTGSGAATVTVAAAEPGGPNRAARKEEARRQREALQRKMARRRYYKIGGAILAVLVAATAITVYIVTRPDPTKAAGCGSVETIKPYTTNPSQDRAHIGGQSANGTVQTAPKLDTYTSVPPASGPHDPNPLPAGVYSSPPDIYRTIHSLEHGAVIVWYPPSAAGTQELSKIQQFYQQASNQDHVIVAPYNYPSQGAAGRLPGGKDMVLAAWHHLMSCTNLSLGAVEEFVSGYRTPTRATGGAPAGYKGDAPEPGLTIG